MSRAARHDRDRRPAPSSAEREPRCASSSSRCSASSTACCTATTRACCPGSAPRRATARVYVPGRRRASHRLEPHRALDRYRTCATRSPITSSRPGSSSTARRASTSGPPGTRSATSRSPRPLRSGSSPPVPATAIGAVVFDATGTAVLPAAVRPGRRARAAAPPPARGPRADVRADGVLRRLSAALQPGAARSARRRGLVVVVSDLLDADDWPRELRGARDPSRRRGRATSPIPATPHLPPVGLLTLVDPETGRRVEVQTDRPQDPRALRRRGRRATHGDQAAPCAARGAGHLSLSTDRDWLLDVGPVRRDAKEAPMTFLAPSRSVAPARGRGLAAVYVVLQRPPASLRGALHEPRPARVRRAHAGRAGAATSRPPRSGWRSSRSS